MSIQLISRNNVKLYLGMVDALGDVDTTNVQHDGLITLIIEQVSARIETYLDRLLKAEERIEYFDTGPGTFYLKAFPVDTDEALTVILDDIEQDLITDDEDGDFHLYAEEGKIVFPCGTGTGSNKALKVTYTGGYAEDPIVEGEDTGVLVVPDDLSRACLLQVVYDFRRRNDIGLSSISMPDGSVSVPQGPSGLLPEVRYILKSFRRLVF